MVVSINIVLKILIILIFNGWVCIWFIVPTNTWKRSWHDAEDKLRSTILGYAGLNFFVLSFPMLAVAILGFIYLYLCAGERTNKRRLVPVPKFSDPVVTHSPLSTLSVVEILSALLFIILLAWTYYSRISTDFKKFIPNKSLHLNPGWEYKLMRSGTRLGSLSEACLALLLLPILRGMSVLQLLGLQFEASVRYHIWLGNLMMLFSTLHGLITMFIWVVKNKLGKQIVQWQVTGRVNVAGVITLVVGVIIWITSLFQIRRKRFELFYYTHHLYVLFILFFLFHTGDRHFYTVFAGVILFALDKLQRIIQSRQVTSLVSARLLPCRAIELTISKSPGMKYNPTSMIFINFPSISAFQWHPFSLTSCCGSDKDTISIIIKCQGQWTNDLYNKLDAEADLDTDHVMHLPVAVEGPYGPSTPYYYRYDCLLLIAGGIGITPFISLLKEFDSRNKKSPIRQQLHLIYVVKKTQDLAVLNSVSHLLLHRSREKEYLKLSIFVTQEEKCNDRLRDLLQKSVQVRRVSFTTKRLNYTMPSPPSVLWRSLLVAIFIVTFLVPLLCLNHEFLHSEEPNSTKKNPSWISDLIIICSFILATICCTAASVLLRWRERKGEICLVSQDEEIDAELQSIGAENRIEEHELHFGQRPNFQDIFSKFSMTMEGLKIGTLVSGPRSMQESVAWCCKQYSRLTNIDLKKKGTSFSYQSLSFTL